MTATIDEYIFRPRAIKRERRGAAAIRTHDFYATWGLRDRLDKLNR